ncbi:type II toxin-antitoxin system HicA family toxin [Cupriavidus necator]
MSSDRTISSSTDQARQGNVPHPKKDLPLGTVRSILKQARIR